MTPAVANGTNATKRYLPRGRNELHTIFEHHYDEKYAATYGMYRLERIHQIGERFSTCGDYRQGVARIRCTNPECGLVGAFGTCTPMHPGHDYFRPFSCRGFYLCPSCSRKRTLLFAEHLTTEVLLDLPHCQFVFTIPKSLRLFFRHDRRLFGEISRLIYCLLGEFYNEAAARPLLTGMVIAHQMFGDTQGRTAGEAEERSRQCFAGIHISMRLFWKAVSITREHFSIFPFQASSRWLKFFGVG